MRCTARPTPLPFHPLELAEAALGTLFGVVYEGPLHLQQVEAETIPLMALPVAEPRRRPFGRAAGEQG